jgi:hypothetical protein
MERGRIKTGWLVGTAVVVVAVVGTVAMLANLARENPVGEGNTNVPVMQEGDGNPVVSVANVLADPASYDGKDICLKGPFQWTVTVMAFGAELQEDESGAQILAAPFVWAGDVFPDQLNKLRCTAAYQEVCSGEIVTCGRFMVAAEGEQGFGHENAYQYGLFRQEQLTESPE